MNFFKLIPYDKKNFIVRKPGLQFCKKEGSVLLKKENNLCRVVPSLQKLVILKKLKAISHFNSNKTIIQYNSFAKFCFTGSITKINVFLKFLKKKAPYFSLNLTLR